MDWEQYKKLVKPIIKKPTITPNNKLSFDINQFMIPHTLDLHGFPINNAFIHFKKWLFDVYSYSNYKIVTVITGHSHNNPAIIHEFNSWCDLPDVSKYIQYIDKKQYTHAFLLKIKRSNH